MNEFQMIDILVNQDWQVVQAVKLYESPGKRFLFHVKFETSKGDVTLVGEAHPDKEGYDNSFSLKFPEPRHETKLQIPDLSEVGWKKIGFGEQWKNTSFETLMKAPRDVTFRHDPLIHIREYPCKTFLDHFVSIELSKKTNDGKVVKLIITASNEEPCCVEVDTTYG